MINNNFDVCFRSNERKQQLNGLRNLMCLQQRYHPFVMFVPIASAHSFASLRDNTIHWVLRIQMYNYILLFSSAFLVSFTIENESARCDFTALNHIVKTRVSCCQRKIFDRCVFLLFEKPVGIGGQKKIIVKTQSEIEMSRFFSSSFASFIYRNIIYSVHWLSSICIADV